MSNMDLTKILGVNPGTCEVKAVKFKKRNSNSHKIISYFLSDYIEFSPLKAEFIKVY
jgi:hypothetical protein